MTPSLSTPLVADLAFVGLALPIALAFILVRAIRRRERRDSRRRVQRLAAIVRQHLRGRFTAAHVADAVRSAAPGEFWISLEIPLARLTRAERTRLGRVLDRTPSVVAERRALLHESPLRRELAARRLGLVPGPRTRRALRAAVGAAPEHVAHAAARALARAGDLALLDWLLSGPEVDRLPHRGPREWAQLLRAFGRRALPRLAEAAEEARVAPRVLRAAVDTLGVARYAAAAPAIERLLLHANADVRVAAARALGRLEAAPCSNALLVALDDAEWPVRALAAWALGRVQRPEAVPALASRLTDREWWVRRHAAYALASLGDRGVAALRDIAAGSADRYARDIADEALRLAASA